MMKSGHLDSDVETKSGHLDSDVETRLIMLAHSTTYMDPIIHRIMNQKNYHNLHQTVYHVSCV